MKSRMFVSLLLFVAGIILAVDKNVILESPIIKVVDGTFINADKIEFIRKLGRTLFDIAFGEQVGNNQRKGKYLFGDKWYSIQALACLEQQFIKERNNEQLLLLQELFVQAKDDFIVQSNEFIKSGRGAKNIIVVLIQEDCQKRNREDSQLLDWAKTKEGQESVMFNQQVKSFTQYNAFLIDLIDFLSDLVYSCPKADAQFKGRVAKWSAVKVILPMIFKKAHVSNEHVNEIAFLKYLKERYLDSIALDEIVPDIIAPLLIEYIKHTNAHA